MTDKQFSELQGKQFTVFRANGKGDFEQPFAGTLISTEAGFLVLRLKDGSRYWAEPYNVIWPR